jgi:hypothetical protein
LMGGWFQQRRMVKMIFTSALLMTDRSSSQQLPPG